MGPPGARSTGFLKPPECARTSKAIPTAVVPGPDLSPHTRLWASLPPEGPASATWQSQAPPLTWMSLEVRAGRGEGGPGGAFARALGTGRVAGLGALALLRGFQHPSIHPSSAWDFYLRVGTQNTTKKEKEGGQREKEEEGRE